MKDTVSRDRVSTACRTASRNASSGRQDRPMPRNSRFWARYLAPSSLPAAPWAAPFVASPDGVTAGPPRQAASAGPLPGHIAVSPSSLHQSLRVGDEVPVTLPHPLGHLADVHRPAGDVPDGLHHILDRGARPGADVEDLQPGLPLSRGH